MTRVHRKFTAEFKAEAVRMISEQGLNLPEVSRKLGIHSNLLRNWKNKAADNGGTTPPRPTQPTSVGRLCIPRSVASPLPPTQVVISVRFVPITTSNSPLNRAAAAAKSDQRRRPRNRHPVPVHHGIIPLHRHDARRVAITAAPVPMHDLRSR